MLAYQVMCILLTTIRLFNLGWGYDQVANFEIRVSDILAVQFLHS